MLKKLAIFFGLISLALFTQAQNPVQINQPYKFLTWVTVRDSIRAASGTYDTTLQLPTGCGTPLGTASLKGGNRKKSAFFFDSCAATLYIFNPKDSSWAASGSGGGSGVTQVNSGYGLTGGPINSTGTLKVDTSSTNHIVTQNDLNDSSAALRAAIGSGGGSGEVNTASNQGSGVGVFKTKSAVDLQFKSITTPGSITATSNTSDVALQLSGDNATPGSNKVYGTNSSGTKGYQSSTVVNLTSPTNGQILKYNSGEWVNIDYTPFFPETQITFRVGIDAAMGAGDSVYTDPLLIGRNVKVHREGELMYRDTIFGIGVDTSTGTITFHPYLSMAEKIIIETANYSTTNPIASLQDLDFPTVVNITHTGTTWSATSSGTIYAGYGRCNKKLASGENGYIQARYTTTDGSAAIIAFNTSNVNEPYADVPASPTVYNYEAGGFLAAGVLYYMDNAAAPGTTGYTLSVGDYWRVVRSGSVLKLQTSPDASTWTDRHTFAFSSTADLYINCNIDANTGANKLFEPKGYNLQ